MKYILLLTLFSALSYGASTTNVPVDAGLKQVYLVDQYGNSLLDGSTNALAVSLGSTVGKSVIGKTGTSTTAAVSTHSIPLTYTVSTGKTFYVTYVEAEAYLTTASATVTNLGKCNLEIPSGTTVASFNMMNASHGAIDRVFLNPAEPLAVNAGQIVVGACDTGQANSTVWRFNFGGYEK